MTYPDLPADLVDGASTLNADTINSAFTQINAMDAGKVDKPVGPANVGVCWVPSAAYLTNNYYWCTLGPLGTNGSHGIGTLRFTPWVVVAPLQINRLIAEHTVVGDTGSVLRLGVYTHDAYGRPDALLLDAGTVSMTAAPGTQGPTVDLTLTPGLYFAAAVVQGGTTQPTLRSVTALYSQAPLGTALPVAGALGHYIKAAVNGALPSTATSISTSSTGSGSCRVGFRVA